MGVKKEFDGVSQLTRVVRMRVVYTKKNSSKERVYNKRRFFYLAGKKNTYVHLTVSSIKHRVKIVIK